MLCEYAHENFNSRGALRRYQKVMQIKKCLILKNVYDSLQETATFCILFTELQIY